MITIWGRANSINVQKVLWCAEELGVPYRRLDAGGAFGVTDQPEFLAMNPNGLVPVLQEDDFVLWESHAIIRYLADRYGQGTLSPSDPRRRANADRWMDWFANTISPSLRVVFWGLVRTPAEKRDGEAIAAAARQMGQDWSILDRHLEGKAFVDGDAFTMGDIPVGAGTYRWMALDIERPSLPNLERWYAALQERESFRRFVMQPLS